MARRRQRRAHSSPRARPAPYTRRALRSRRAAPRIQPPGARATMRATAAAALLLLLAASTARPATSDAPSSPGGKATPAPVGAVEWGVYHSA